MPFLVDWIGKMAHPVSFCTVYISLETIDCGSLKFPSVVYKHSSEIDSAEIRRLFCGQKTLFYKVLTERQISVIEITSERKNFTDEKVRRACEKIGRDFNLS